MVYVLNIDGKPLMPTARLGRVHRLLKEHKAIVVKYHPFTIKLTYSCNSKVQEVSLGVDAGSKPTIFGTGIETRGFYDTKGSFAECSLYAV